ncbi:MAG: GAF domain-containing protein [Williamsia sp.]|nr:GAF domain-containing protein [Williamsia sp.]
MRNQYQFSEKHESNRLAQLQQYNILDTASEEEYNDIARLAAHICDTPLAFITFIDAHRQWMKSSVGVDVSETPRIHAFCHYAIQQPDELMVVEDFSKDARFQMHPFVAGEPHLAFYAGMPLTNMHGYALGTICVLDAKPRTLTPKQKRALKLFSIQLMHMLELRRINHEHETLQAQLRSDNPAADLYIQAVTARIRQSLTDVVKEKGQWEGWYRNEDNEVPPCAQKLERIEIDMKSLIQRILSHYPDER